MYPIRRQIIEALRCRKLPALAPGDVHVNHMRAWPWDIDPFGDLNNGRIITLMDVGRIGLAQRMGLIAAMRTNKWGLAMAGSAPQYRRRVTMWEPLEFRSRLVARDTRFFFIEQTLYVRGAPACNMMCRTVITSRGGIVPTDEVAAAIGRPDWNPQAPQWALDWARADTSRPWPPDPMTG